MRNGKLLIKVWRNRLGASAVEFALISVPVLLLILGTIQNVLTGLAFASLDFALQSLAYDASNADGLIFPSVLTRNDFCQRTAFYFVDCTTSNKLCFSVAPFDPYGPNPTPATDCIEGTAIDTSSCCYQAIVEYEIPRSLDVIGQIQTLSGMAQTPRVVRSVALIYRG